MLSSSIISCLHYDRTASKAKRSTAQRSQPAQAAKQVRADQSATTQASRQGWLQPACRRAFRQLAVFSKRTKKSGSARPTQMSNHSQRSLADVMREGFACTLLFLSVLSISSIRAASGLFSWPMDPSSWHLQVSSLHLNHGPLCALHSFAFCSILPCERA